MPKPLSKDQKLVIGYLTEINFTIVESDFSDQLLMNGKIVTYNGKIFNTLIELQERIITYPKIYSIDSGLAYYFPHIELPREDDLGTINGMCYVKENEKLYSNNPKEIVHKALNKYINLCEDIANNRFSNRVNEFLDEFDSYWPIHYSPFYTYLTTKLKDKQKIDIAILQNDTHNQQIIYDDFNALKRYAISSNMNISIYSSIYIDIGSNISIPFPNKIKDLIRLFKASGHLLYLKKQLKKNTIFNALFIGLSLPKGKKHYAAISLDKNNYSKADKTKNGYQIFFSETLENEPFFGAHIKSINKKWLMQRGGNDATQKVSQKNFSIAILGCGSIGSNLAYKLCKSGISNITLVDPGKLESSNIGRHYLGMNNVGKLKVEAMKETLMTQFIGMNVVAHAKHAENCIQELQDINLIIGAIGSDAPAVETYMAGLTINKELPPILSCWLEANAIAGHAFYLDNSFELNSFDNATDRLNILDYKFASSLIQNEVGCNSDYMPYSHLEADSHINKMAQFIIEISLGKKDKRALSSYGDIEQFKSNLIYSVQPHSIKYWSDDEIKIQS